MLVFNGNNAMIGISKVFFLFQIGMAVHNGTGDVQKTIEHFIDAVKDHAPVDRLRHYLGETKARHIVEWKDTNDLDLLHHCILMKSVEAVEFLLSYKYFNESHQPLYNPYLHLAAKLGHRSIIGLLIKYRPNDDRPLSNLIYPEVMNKADKNLCIILENQIKVVV